MTPPAFPVPVARAALRRAVIDVGTNSVKLLVADVAGPAVNAVVEQSEQTRLGRGFYRTHHLSSSAIAHTAQAVAAFRVAAGKLGATAVRVIATSAARDAKNAAELLAAVEKASGLRVEIITGDQEAEWAFLGINTDPRLAGRPVLVVEIGGGSTQIVVGAGARLAFRRSFPLGTVRLQEQHAPSDPPTAAERHACFAGIDRFLADTVAPVLQPALSALASGSVVCVGTGGTASILGLMELGTAEFDRARLDGLELAGARVRQQCAQLWSLPLAARRRVPGLPPERADVILMGVAIYATVLDRFGFDRLRVSLRGVRYGALLAAPAAAATAKFS
jgi:exopolyphosphatase/guanosine-5'-triphosphate,3'-diphosphate pyrophosphatase